MPMPLRVTSLRIPQSSSACPLLSRRGGDGTERLRRRGADGPTVIANLATLEPDLRLAYDSGFDVLGELTDLALRLRVIDGSAKTTGSKL
jgi:hypothetical protein